MLDRLSDRIVNISLYIRLRISLVFATSILITSSGSITPNATDLADIQILNVSTAQSLTQIVEFPNRFHNNSDGHSLLLDLLFTSPDLCRALQISPLGKSDPHVCRYLFPLIY